MSLIIDGKKISLQIKNELRAAVSALKKDRNIIPGLAVILVGSNPASKVYVTMKEKACAEIGVYSEKHLIDEAVSTEKLVELIKSLNKSGKIHGILVQLPLPGRINAEKVIESVHPSKDVDCFHPYNVGRLLTGNPVMPPCTPAGIQELLLKSGVNPEGRHVVILGRSNIVGKPLFSILCQKAIGANATVTLCHSRTENMKEITSSADILIAAIGKPRFVKADMVKTDSVVIDVGTNRVNDETAEKGYKIVGDVDFENVKNKVKAISPVPGGVGPMTIAMLMKNTFNACLEQTGGRNRGDMYNG
ncbi:bifunctional methylenetetrahydrofolate dehydrogenase/methenyltetrahydrofolate cyclohydrolase FolD [bacterium]|jgi:methylenetetrahydrofolate dehydrogenase (NADP+)/methenyltetrahydrofolate cyclohydrolase|nr:bifunctional methylenetetrahydrofolate dehydrogenase/methenyltetrahydrofolate cyclohydrolase FolD [bacterium]